MARGRRVLFMSRIPRSEACWARKRKSMLCAFSWLRAMLGGCWWCCGVKEVVWETTEAALPGGGGVCECQGGSGVICCYGRYNVAFLRCSES